MTNWEAYILKAEENLRLAQIGFEEQCFNASASRAYYAGFQAAIAALLKSSFPRGKFDHKWVQAEFNEKLIKRKKIYPNKFKSYLMEMQLIRNTADYERESLGRKGAEKQLQKAQELLGAVKMEVFQ